MYYTIPDDAGVRVNKSSVSGYPSDTYTSPNDYIHKLNGSGTKIGSSIVLRVMSGDKVNIMAKDWYKTNGTSPGTASDPLSTLVTALINQVPAEAGGKIPSGSLNSTILDPSATALLTDRNTNYYNSSKPKAFLNYILLDEQMKPVIKMIR